MYVCIYLSIYWSPIYHLSVVYLSMYLPHYLYDLESGMKITYHSSLKRTVVLDQWPNSEKFRVSVDTVVNEGL